MRSLQLNTIYASNVVVPMQQDTTSSLKDGKGTAHAVFRSERKTVCSAKAIFLFHLRTFLNVHTTQPCVLAAIRVLLCDQRRLHILSLGST